MPNGSDASLACLNCGLERGLDARLDAHRCCRCADGGRVRISGEIGTEGFGRTAPCPECAGGSANPEIVEDANARMRVPWKYADVTFDAWLPANGSPRLRCQTYAASWPPPTPFLFLTGNKGTGKTTLAIATMKAVRERWGKHGQFWLVQRLLDRINATYDEDAEETLTQVMSQMERVPLLVLDDLGSEKSTEAARARLFTIIDHRYSHGLAMIVTTNATANELDPRIKSRFSDAQVTTLAKFDGRDMRPEA